MDEINCRFFIRRFLLSFKIVHSKQQQKKDGKTVTLQAKEWSALGLSQFIEEKIPQNSQVRSASLILKDGSVVYSG